MGTGRNGNARVYSGRDGSLIRTFAGDSVDDALGWCVRRAGDVDQDGIEDVIVSAPGDDHAAHDGGSARVFSAKDGATLDRFDGALPGGGLLMVASGAGDVNDDGFADLVVAGMLTDTRSFSGRDGTQLYRFGGGAWSVSNAQDVNGDGLVDLVLGAAGQNVAMVVAGNDLFLDAETREPVAGDTLTLATRQGPPGKPAALFTMALNGVLFFLRLAARSFASDGGFVISGSVPPGLSGLEIAFRSFTERSSGGVRDTANEVVAFQ